MSTEKFVMKGNKPVIDKDPSSILDYIVDFAALLVPVSDTIISANIAVTGGLVVDSVEFSDLTITGWLSGGTVRPPGGAYASATYRFTTVNNPSREDERTVFFDVKER